MGNPISNTFPTGYVRQHDGMTAAALDFYDTSRADTFQGITWNDVDMIMTAGSSSDDIERKVGFSSTPRDEFNAPTANPHSVTWSREADVWHVESVGNDVYQLTGFTSTPQQQFGAPGPFAIGISDDGVNTIIADFTENLIYVMVAHTSTPDFSFSAAGTATRDCTWSGADILHADHTDGKMYRLTGKTSTPQDDFSLAACIGATWDSYADRMSEGGASVQPIIMVM